MTVNITDILYAYYVCFIFIFYFFGGYSVFYFVMYKWAFIIQGNYLPPIQ